MKSIIDKIRSQINEATIKIINNSKGEFTTLSYQELYSKGCNVSHRLRELGVCKTERVMTIMSSSELFLTVVIGSWLSRCSIVPIPPPIFFGQNNLYSKKILEMIEISKPKIIICDENIFELNRTIIGDKSRLLIISSGEIYENNLDKYEEPHDMPQLEDIAHIQFTSGSTGTPKAVIIKHKNLAANCQNIGQICFKKDNLSTMVSWLPIHHDMGFTGGLCSSLYNNHNLALIPTELFMRNPLIWLKTITNHQGTHSPAPTFAYKLLASRFNDNRLEGLDLSSWEYAWIGAEPIFTDTLHRFYTRFEKYGLKKFVLKPCYGLAESTLAVTLTPLDETYEVEKIYASSVEDESQNKINLDRKEVIQESVSLGSIVDGMELKILNKAGELAQEREEGLIFIRGTSRMAGYFEGNETEIDRNGWFNTGDLGFLVKQNLYITGRQKDVIKYNGMSIHPQEIEVLVESIEGLRIGSAICFPSLNNNLNKEEIILIVEGKNLDDDEKKSLINLITTKIFSQINVIIDKVLIVKFGRIPKTTSGKLQRSLSRQKYIEKEFAQKL